MKKPINSRTVRAAAASLRGALSLGIETEDSLAAHDIFERAKINMARWETKKSQGKLERGGRAYSMYCNFKSAFNELAAQIERGKK